MKPAADLLTSLRVLLALPFAWALATQHGASCLPLAIFGLAALTDFLDGRLARAAGGTSATGRLFDHAADAAFLFPALAVLASRGRVASLLPSAATAAFALYLLDGQRRGGGRAGVDLLPSRSGAIAGVVNYAIAGVAAVTVWLGASALDAPLYGASLAAAAANGAAALERLQVMSRSAQPAA